MSLIINIALAAVFAVALARIVYIMVPAYRAATGSPWQRLLAAGDDSAVRVVTRLANIVFSSLGLVCIFGDAILGTPEFQAAVQAYVPAQYIPAVMLGVMILVSAARSRTLRQG